MNTLHKMPQPCSNLVTTLQSCGKVATTSKFPYGFTKELDLELYEAMSQHRPQHLAKCMDEMYVKEGCFLTNTLEN